MAEADTDQDEVTEEPADEQVDGDHLAPVLAGLALAPSVPFDAQEATAGLTNGNGKAGHANGNGNGHAGGLAARLHGLAAAARNGNGIGDRPVEEAPEQEHVLGGAAMAAGEPHGTARTPASMDEDETPIFRSLRSNWLSTDSGERPWATTEVDAGLGRRRAGRGDPARAADRDRPARTPSRQPPGPGRAVDPGTRPDRARPGGHPGAAGGPRRRRLPRPHRGRRARHHHTEEADPA